MLASAVARADDAPSVSLDYTATSEAATCGSAEDLRARIAERLGRDPFNQGQARGTLRVRIARASTRWSAALTLVDTAGATFGARTLEETATTCEPLLRSIAFTVSVLLDDLAPAATATAPTITPAPAPTAPSRAEDPFPPPAPAAPPPEAPHPRTRIDGALAAVLAFGIAPATAVGLDVGFGADLGDSKVRAELGGRAHLPAGSDDAVSVRTRLLFARVAPCYGPALLSGCLAFALGSLSGEGTGAGVASARLASQLYAAAGPALESRIMLGDVAFIRVGAELWIPLTRAAFDVGSVRAFTLPAASAAGTLGLGARLP